MSLTTSDELAALKAELIGAKAELAVDKANLATATANVNDPKLIDQRDFFLGREAVALKVWEASLGRVKDLEALLEKEKDRGEFPLPRLQVRLTCFEFSFQKGTH